MNAIVSFVTKPIPLYAAALGAVSGAVGAYFFLDWKLGREFDERLQAEMDGIRIYYGTPKPASPEDLVAARYPEIDNQLDLIQALKYDTPPNDNMTEVAKNVFTDAEDLNGFDAEAEAENRDMGQPYVMLHDEFYESDLVAVTLEYYDGDGVLADDKGKPIEDVDNLIGHDNLLKFGQGSRDKNIVYVCNPELDCIFEVVRNDGRFDEIVLGLKHSDPSRLRRMRPEEY